jgi:3'-5' exonuclease
VFKFIAPKVWAFDAEWAPDPESGRRVLGLPDDMPDADVVAALWQAGGATAEDPTPYLKTVLCRVVSVAMVARQIGQGGKVTLSLISLPREPADPAQQRERHIVGSFLSAVGKHKPQLVGYNSEAADIKIFIQRALASGVVAPEFCTRPNKPWEGVDYFARGSDWHLDLKTIVSGFGKASPSLNEMAVVCGIPGKLGGMDGEQVPTLWLAGELARIVAYNETDAITTYLLWLRMAHMAGHFDEEGYAEERTRVRELLQSRAAAGAHHLAEYLAAWEALSARAGEAW